MWTNSLLLDEPGIGTIRGIGNWILTVYTDGVAEWEWIAEWNDKRMRPTFSAARRNK